MLRPVLLGLALASTAALGGCVMAAYRAGRALVLDHNADLQKEREAAWGALWPVLQRECARADREDPPLPAGRPVALPLKAAGATLLFDTRSTGQAQDPRLIVPRAVSDMLRVARQLRAPLAPGPLPEGVDYAVSWRRSDLPSPMPALMTGMERLTLQIHDASGAVVARDTQLALLWVGSFLTEYQSCVHLLKPTAQHPQGQPTPDFLFLKEVFGVRDLALPD